MKMTKQGVRDLGHDAPKRRPKCVPDEHNYKFITERDGRDLFCCAWCGDELWQPSRRESSLLF